MLDMRPVLDRFLLPSLVTLLVVSACTVQKKLATLSQQEVEINLPDLPDFLPDNVSGTAFSHQDTLVLKGEDGRDVMIMKAIKDEETGEMVATDVIDAAVITARFRNKAERNGMVDLEFEITVPPGLLDDQWVMTLYPNLYMLGDSLRLDPVVLTGEGFRRQQLEGYRKYKKYEEGIDLDSTHYVRNRLLGRFMERNGDAGSWAGVEQDEALRHYTRDRALRRQQQKWDNRDKRFRQLVKVPIQSEGVRLDSVVRASGEGFTYTYVQTIRTRPNLRKVNLVLSGEITRMDKRVYSIPDSDSLTFYISTLSNFVQDRVRYKTRIVYRRAEANTSCFLLFPVGKGDIKPELGNNAGEIHRIKETLRYLMANEVFDLDSVVVTANASPEGAWEKNARLSDLRSGSVMRYFNVFMTQIQDSIQRERGFEVDAEGAIHKEEVTPVRLLSRSHPENWEELDRLMQADTSFTGEQRARYFELRAMDHPDRRERALSREPFYRHMRDSLYPLLRTVSFDFHLHRKGMVKDTIQTTVLDDVYAEGLQALRDRDYEKAVTILAPYNDYNTAVAYCALDRNYNALEILEKEEKTGEVNYMLAILKSRTGDIQGAVQCYMEACRQNPMYISRGNLDPEISVLIKTYGLNKQDDEEYW